MKRYLNPMRWHWIVAVFIIPLLATLLTFAVSLRAGTILMLFWPLWLAWRFDNNLGAFFMLTILLYIVFFVIGLLFAAIVALGTYGTVGGI